MVDTNKLGKLTYIGGVLIVVVGLYLSSLYSYILFHSLIEIVTIAIAFALFILTWNTQQYLKSSYLRLLGIGYAFIAIIDLFHTLAYKGMGVFPTFGSNQPTQLWIAARYLQAVTLLVAPSLVRRKIDSRTLVVLYAVAVSTLVAMVFTGNFPDCYIEGQGLTPFKINSEYFISIALLVALYLFYRQRKYFDDKVFWLISTSIGCTVISEISFTAYVSVYGFANLVGHFAKLTAFYLTYQAILVTGLQQPFALIFRDLKQAEAALLRSQNTLEQKIKERTAELEQSNGKLQQQIEENNRTLESLKLSQERYRILFEDSPISLWEEDFSGVQKYFDELRTAGVTDWTSYFASHPEAVNYCAGLIKIVDVNKATVALVGATSKDELLANLERVLAVEALGVFRQELIALANGDRQFESESIHRTITGEMKQINLNLSVAPGSEHTLDQVLLSVLDITELKRTSQALQESEERFRTAFENANVGVCLVATDGRLLKVNDAMSQIFGYSRQELEQMTTTSIAYPEDLEISPAFIKNALSGETNQASFDKRYIHKQGHVIWGHVSSALVCDSQGKPLYFISHVQDITQRKHAEEALRESEERLRQIASSLREVVWLRDVKTRQILYVNPAFQQLTGRTCESFYANRDLMLETIHPDDKAWVIEALAQRENIPYDKEHRIVHLDGSVRWVASRIFPVRNEAGELYRWASIMEDITERKRAEAEIRRLNQELEQRVVDRTAQLEAANKELEAFAYSVSHDLRAPLRHIDGFLELLQTKTSITWDAESQHYMANISDAAKRMGILIDDLLSFSRMGRSGMSKMPVDLTSLVHEVILDLTPETKNRNIRWYIDNLPTVIGDRAMLRVVLVNLISNALKFTRPRAQAKIEIGCTPSQSDQVVIFVRDNGVGFDMQYADKLFGVFQRLHRAEDFEGTGIGLANVRRIINRHGGRTWAESQVDHGATFYFSLPDKASEGRR